MKYTIDIGGRGEVMVDSIEFGVATEGAVEGWADIYISVRDSEMDIYTDPSKKVWIDWLNANCGEKHNPEERIVSVIAKVYGNDDTVYRSIEIQNAYLADYVEESMAANHSYTAMIKRAPTRKGDIKVTGGMS